MIKSDTLYMLITDMENLSQFYQLRHLTEPCIVKYMTCSLQTQQTQGMSAVVTGLTE